MAIDTLGANALASNSVTTAKIAADAVTSAKIPAGAVVASDVADGSVTTAKLADDAITNAKIADDAIQVENFAGTVPFGRRNLLINGDFQEWQRGTTGTVNQYVCDRWYGWGNQQNQSQQQAENSTHNSGRFALRIAHNDGTANTFSAIAQTLETKDAAQCRGKKVTFSIDVKKGSAFTGTLTLQIVTRTDAEGTINTGTRQVLVTEDITSSLTTSLQRFTCTTSTVCAQNIRTIGVNVIHGGTSGTDANNFFQVERAQLEIGEHATAFETQSAHDNLQACKRYYYALGGDTPYQTVNTVVNFTGGQMLGHYQHPVQMRAAATITKTGNWSTLGGDTTVGQGVSADQNGPRTIQLGFNGGSGGTSGRAATLRWANNINARLAFSAEF